jgi:hypothetical protein
MFSGSDEDAALGRLRVIAAGVFTILSALLVLAWIGGRENAEPILGIVIAALVTLLGIPVLQRAITGRNGK